MKDAKKIKIVKKIDSHSRDRRKVKVETPRMKAREMVATVSDWVTELKTRKQNETQAAIDSLFGSTSRPAES